MCLAPGVAGVLCLTESAMATRPPMQLRGRRTRTSSRPSELCARVAEWITGQTVTREAGVRAWARARPFFALAGLLLTLAAVGEARHLLLRHAPSIWTDPVCGGQTWRAPSELQPGEPLLPSADAGPLLTALHRARAAEFEEPNVTAVEDQRETLPPQNPILRQ